MITIHKGFVAKTPHSIRFVLAQSASFRANEMAILFTSTYKLFHLAHFFFLSGHSTMLPAAFLPQEGSTYRICSIIFSAFWRILSYVFHTLIKFIVFCHAVSWLPVLAGIFLVPCNPCTQHLSASAGREHVELHRQVLWAGRSYDVLHTWQRHNSLSAEHPGL